ncbi:MAG: HAD-IIIA family hydrolase [Myxococcales bacterium]|nr:HAD-IIIA family hydrolase [Myxococcales bacterium]
MLRRAVDAQRATRLAEQKALYAGHIARIQAATSPPLGNGELAVAFELPVTAVGRYLSDAPRARTAAPDRFTRALIDALCAGDAWLALREATRIGGRREVLVCTEVEARRLDAGWTLVNVAGRPLPRAPRADWDQDALWDLFDAAPAAAPTRGALLPWRPVGPADDRLWLSPIGLGAMRLSTEGRPDEAAAIRVLHAAFDAGLGWLDTANVYALGEDDVGHGEALVRRALASWPGDREDVIVATKGGLRRQGTRWLPDGRPESLKAACEASLRALGVERLDLYQLHAVDGRVPLAESVDALAELRRAGLVRHLGLCNVTADQIALACGRAPFVSVQNPLSAVEPQHFEKTVDFCRDAGLAFIAHSPLGGYRRVERLLADAAFRQVADRHGASPGAVALAWLLQAGPHVFAIPGARSVERVDDMATALRLRLTTDDLATLSARVPGGPRAPAADPGDVALILGTPAAGKSSRVRPFEARGYVRLNRDERGGSLDGLLVPFREAVAEGARRFVLDNTYGTRRSRASILAAAADAGLPVRAVWLDTPAEAAAFHAARRLLDVHGHLLGPAELKSDTTPNIFPPAVLTRYEREFEAPIRGEGFASVQRVPYRRVLDPTWTGRALVLDYDGTLRTTASGELYPRHPDDVVVLPGRAEVLRRYRDAGFRLLGISNQSGVAAGHLTEEAALACIARTNALLGVDIEAEICPHPAGRAPACYCRKPMPGIGVLFIERYQLDPARCLMVGDLDTDRGFAEAAGFRFVHADDFFSPDRAHPEVECDTPC